MFVCVRERLAQGVCQKGRPAGPSLRQSGGDWGGPKPSSEPSLPAASPPRLRDLRTNPGSLTPSSPPRSRGLFRVSQLAHFPLDPLRASRRPNFVLLREAARVEGALLRGREELNREVCGNNRGPLAPHLSLPSYLVPSGEERKRCWFGILVGKSVCLDVCRGGAGG